MLAVSSSVDSPKLCAIAGSAVVTIVASSVSMKNAAATMSGIRRENGSARSSAFGSLTGTACSRSMDSANEFTAVPPSVGCGSVLIPRQAMTRSVPSMFSWPEPQNTSHRKMNSPTLVGVMGTSIV